MVANLRLRLPRALVDPLRRDLPCGDADGLLAVELHLAEGRVAAIHSLAGEPGTESLPLALTPLVDAHVHLDKAFSWGAYPNRAGTMAGALAANLREGERRSVEQVLERALF